ncbi:MAG: SDR family oxidoreductase [Acidimicrobiia bacterium]
MRAARAAVTRSLAVEYVSRGVRVNAVSLEVIKTLCTTPPPTRAWPA